MLYHKMKVAGIDCSLPICRVSDDLYIGAFIILGNAALSEAAANQLLEKAPNMTIL